MSILLRSIELLKKEPYLTSWEIATELGEKVSAVSSILYRNTLRDTARVERRRSDKFRRGYEYSVKEKK